MPQLRCFPRFLWHRLSSDERGVAAVTTGLAFTVLTGFAGIAVDVAMWEVSRRDMQGAADQAAYSAALAAQSGTSTGAVNAKGITANMGFVDGQSGVTVTVNNPPSQGGYKTNTTAWEVIVTKPQKMYFANSFFSSQPIASARAVALAAGSTYCMLVLNPSASGALNLQGNPSLNTPGCSIQVNSSSPSALTSGGSGSITTNKISIVGGYNVSGASQINAAIKTGASAIADPYANRNIPSYTSAPCLTFPSISGGGTVTLPAPAFSSGGVMLARYCGGMNVGKGIATLPPGVYVIDGGTLGSNGGTLIGNGVTLILTGSSGNYANVNFSGNSTINLTAPSTGPMAGIAIYQDRNAPASTSNYLTGGSGQKFTGALYFPSTTVNYQGSAATAYCTQLVASGVNMQGDGSFQNSCTGVGITSISTLSVALAE